MSVARELGPEVANVDRDWGNFGRVAGAASGALIGLLFVEVLPNRDRITQHPALRASALQALVVFMLPLLVATLLLTPQQPSWVLGIELITLGGVNWLALAMAGRWKWNAGNELHSRLARLLNYTSPNLLTTLLVLAGGATLVAGHVGGLYWLVPAVVLALIGGVAKGGCSLSRIRTDKAGAAQGLSGYSCP